MQARIRSFVGERISVVRLFTANFPLEGDQRFPFSSFNPYPDGSRVLISQLRICKHDMPSFLVVQINTWHDYMPKIETSSATSHFTSRKSANTSNSKIKSDLDLSFSNEHIDNYPDAKSPSHVRHRQGNPADQKSHEIFFISLEASN